MLVDVIGPHIEIVDGAGGPKAVIAGSRIRVQDVVMWFHDQGMLADEIVENFPTITRADVFAALAYYWDHREEIQAEIARGIAFEEEFLRMYPSRLAERRASRQAG